jgi:hypothetical protein
MICTYKIVVGVPRLDLSLDDVEYHFIYAVVMETSQLITAAGVQTAAYRAKLAALKENLPVAPIYPSTNASQTTAITNNQLPPGAISMLVEANIDVIALVLQTQNNPLVKFFITGIFNAYLYY